MANPWFKFYANDFLSEPKLKGVSTAKKSCFITALCYAANYEGNLDTRDISSDLIKIEAGVRLGGEEWDEVGDIYEWMVGKRFGHLENGVFVFKNWETRQVMTAYERVKKHRAKMKNDNADDNKLITAEQIRIDKNREEKNTPWFVKISEKHDEYKDLIRELAERDYLPASKIHQILEEEMVPYYREKGSALKERWERERTFDYLLRARTWIKKHHEFKKDVRCRKAAKWHGKGESCYCDD